MLLALLIAAATAACPGEPVGPDRLAGLPLVGPMLETPDGELVLPGETRLTVPVSAPARAEVVFSAPCQPVSVTEDGADRQLQISPEGNGFTPLSGLPASSPVGRLMISLGQQRAELAVSSVTLRASEGGWSTTLQIARPRPAPPQPPELRVTWLPGGRVFDEHASGSDAWLVAALGLLTPPLDRLGASERVALFRLWASEPLLVPLDAVVALQTRAVSAAEREALGHLRYPPGDRRYAGATVLVPGEARLLANGREVQGRPVEAALFGSDAPSAVTAFVLPIGGPVWLRVEDRHGAYEHRVVVDSGSRVELVAFMAMGEMPKGERTFVTEGQASFTFCEGRPIQGGVCPRWSANNPSQLHATANQGPEQRSIEFMPYALGTYTIVWEDADLGLRWSPAP